ncbi:glutathione S-transferase [Lepidopterella palustris CBS 459.81]|uniref:Glutathione S-transferase n=1 Tax=Lepidopterella palustris CBS 459.81 TaxID=1314670 RepID=A0A8E2EE01_9PEZI|nr:glutathione S-transferase [Lepidopterella palustris CBS 459.81]
MAPFATLHTTPNFLNARIAKTLAAASINNLTLTIPSDFIMGTTNKSPEYLAKFPMGKIPALETPSGFRLTEATAISFYIADSGPKREQLLGRTPEERALVHMWVGLSDTEIFPNLGAVLTPMLGRGEYVKKTVEEKEAALMRALRRIELHLKGDGEGRKWLLDGEELSLADLSVAGSMLWVFKYLLDQEAREEFPETVAWYRRVLAVEGVEEAFGGPPVFCEVRLPPFPENGEQVAV